MEKDGAAAGWRVVCADCRHPECSIIHSEHSSAAAEEGAAALVTISVARGQAGTTGDHRGSQGITGDHRGSQ